MEIWKDIPGYEGFYQASNLGRIKSFFGQGKILRFVEHNGYLTVSLRNKRYAVHRLIALTFIENPLNKKCVNHIDGLKKNNKIENLEWVTDGENIRHGFKNGLYKNTLISNSFRFKGAKNPKAKLNLKKINQIKKLYSSKSLKQTELAEKFGVSQSQISAIILGKCWL